MRYRTTFYIYIFYKFVLYNRSLMKIKAFAFAAILGTVLLNSCLHSDIKPDQLSIEIENIDKIVAKDTANYIVYHSIGYKPGIRLAVHNFGEGTIPHSGQTVSFKYSGTLLSDPSTVVDSGSYNGLINNIPVYGLGAAISLLPVGSNSAAYVPSSYAYGSTGKGKIPGNATLVYEIQSLSVTMSTLEQIQFNKDTAAIHKYLVDHNITNAVLHPSGIWYTIISEGAGARPRVFDRITCVYKGSLLSNGSVFDNGTLTDQSLFGLIDGFRVGIPLLKQGTKATLYIPSTLAYKASNLNGIPQNSNLAFEIELQSFKK